jgi:hypothetical protein
MRPPVLILAIVALAFTACKPPPPATRPSWLAPEGVYYLINASKVPREYAGLRLTSGAQLVHISEDLYQAGQHQVRLAPELVTNDKRIRQQILEDLRTAENERRDREAEAARLAAERPPATPSMIQQGAYNQRRAVRRTYSN